MFKIRFSALGDTFMYGRSFYVPIESVFREGVLILHTSGICVRVCLLFVPVVWCVKKVRKYGLICDETSRVCLGIKYWSVTSRADIPQIISIQMVINLRTAFKCKQHCSTITSQVEGI